MHRAWWFLVAGAVFGSGACSSESSAPATGPCNALAYDGPTVTMMLSTSTAPAPRGGTVTDGTYQLTAMTLYGAPATIPIPPVVSSATIQIAGTTMEQAGILNGEEKRYTSTFATAGTSVTTTDSCPAPSSSTHSYTATATSILIYDSSVGTLEQTYTRR